MANSISNKFILLVVCCMVMIVIATPNFTPQPHYINSVVSTNAFLLLGLRNSGTSVIGNYLLSNHGFILKSLQQPFKVGEHDKTTFNMFFSTTFNAQIINTLILATNNSAAFIINRLSQLPLDVSVIIYSLSLDDTMTTIQSAINLAESTNISNVHSNVELLKIVLVPKEVKADSNKNHLIEQFTNNNWICYDINGPIQPDKSTILALYRFVAFLWKQRVINNIVNYSYFQITMAKYIETVDKIKATPVPNVVVTTVDLQPKKATNNLNFNVVSKEEDIEIVVNQAEGYLSMWIDFFSTLKLTHIKVVLLDINNQLKKIRQVKKCALQLNKIIVKRDAQLPKHVAHPRKFVQLQSQLGSAITVSSSLGILLIQGAVTRGRQLSSLATIAFNEHEQSLCTTNNKYKEYSGNDVEASRVHNMKRAMYIIGCYCKQVGLFAHAEYIDNHIISLLDKTSY